MISIEQKLAEELGVKKEQVEATVALLDEGNTVPFIARYRKEVTGSLDDEVLRKLAERLTYLRTLNGKKSDIERYITDQGKMTDELKAAIDVATTVTELDDIYRPFRPKKRTRALLRRKRACSPWPISFWQAKATFQQRRYAMSAKTRILNPLMRPSIMPWISLLRNSPMMRTTGNGSGNMY